MQTKPRIEQTNWEEEEYRKLTDSAKADYIITASTTQRADEVVPKMTPAIAQIILNESWKDNHWFNNGSAISIIDAISKIRPDPQRQDQYQEILALKDSSGMGFAEIAKNIIEYGPGLTEGHLSRLKEALLVFEKSKPAEKRESIHKNQNVELNVDDLANEKKAEKIKKIMAKLEKKIDKKYVDIEDKILENKTFHLALCKYSKEPTSSNAQNLVEIANTEGMKDLLTKASKMTMSLTDKLAKIGKSVSKFIGRKRVSNGKHSDSKQNPSKVPYTKL